jgi:predicted nucleotidyltransferase
MDLFGLKKEQVLSIQTVLASYEDIEQAIVFGSRAKGSYKPGSDIDLAIKSTGNKFMTQLLLDLDDLYLPYTFDVVILQEITNPDLTAHIERAGKVLYKRQ